VLLLTMGRLTSFCIDRKGQTMCSMFKTNLPFLALIVTLASIQIISVPLANANTPISNCVLGDSSKTGISITSCQYHLSDSPAGNRNYYLVVDVSYRASRPVGAVRFAFNIDGSMRYMVARPSVRQGAESQEFQLISPKQTVKKLVCWADQATT